MSSLTAFDYMLNAMERAALEEKPADHGYGEKRRAMRAHVAQLEKDAARYRLVRRGQHWSTIDGIGDTLRANDLDEAVDDVIAKDAP